MAAIQICIAMSKPEKSNFNPIIQEIIKKSLFTERQIEIILKQKKLLYVEFDMSKGAYYRQVAQSRNKIESVYYTLILLQAFDVIFPDVDVISRLVEQVSVIKDNEIAPENEGQIVDVIHKTVKQLVGV